MKHSALFFLALFAPSQSVFAFELSLPVACDPGKTCIVQNYVDTNPGPQWQDYRCGAASYDGHKGTDFRVHPFTLNKKSSTVVAAADGVVKALRDSEDEKFIRTANDRRAIKGRECGNGLVISHAGGWETQYCHLKRGSLIVKPGQKVRTGAPLGRIGNSGNTTFYHLHFTVRQNGKVVDPFNGQAQTKATCAATNDRSPGALWNPSAQASLTYQDVAIFNAGFTDEPMSGGDMERAAIPKPSATSSALIFYANVVHPRAGDRIRLDITGPKGFQASSTTKPMDRAKAQFVAYVGKRLRTARWTAGTYTGAVTVVRNGKVVKRETRTWILAE